MFPAALLLLSGSVAAAAENPPGNPLVEELARCLDIPDDARRLACTDRAGRALVAAERARDVVVVDRGEVKRARRSLFGLSVDPAELFAGRAAPADRVTALDTAVRSAAPLGNDRWSLVLTEGGRWRTLEPWTGPDPKPGAAVSVHAGTLGSYRLKMAGGRWVAAARTM